MGRSHRSQKGLVPGTFSSLTRPHGCDRILAEHNSGGGDMKEGLQRWPGPVKMVRVDSPCVSQPKTRFFLILGSTDSASALLVICHHYSRKPGQGTVIGPRGDSLQGTG